MAELDRIAELLPLLLQGALVTLKIAAMSLLAAVVVSFIVALGRLSKFRALRWTALVFLEVFRGTSLLVQLYFLYFILPLHGVRLGAKLLCLDRNDTEKYCRVRRICLQFT